MSNFRVRIAALLLCSLTLLSIVTAAAVRKSCTVLIRQTEIVMTADNPAAEINRLTAEWNRQRKLLHYFVADQPLTDLNAAIAQLDALHAAQSDTLSAALQTIIADLQWICTTELSVF